MEDKKYFFGQDQDCHWYMIPLDLKEIWNELSDMEDPSEDDRWQQIEDCNVGGCISSIVFTNPKEQ